ncbi:CRP-like cAMP-binding protein [Cytobacillus firmus]|uniref:CRP-like cAMP-binding protein n=2 Tax=Cytobacillus TaxID=2675230 RepID=A0A366K182_CYTFI|nr:MULTISPECIES: Crp/Fnr family transcriptional regulator [Cytobacillus]RBP95430.1 CRP-like cAMP-binding protein [Cytobacillus firmus]TDX44271.1 CRP-like cAMP-binding protein [Cytobacillus oceanisediminis]
MKDTIIQYMKRFTDLSDAELEKIAEDLHVTTFKKGTILLHQGEVPDKCYFVLKGCVRQYAVDESGKEITFNFFTEEQSVTIFNQHMNNKASNYSICCMEDCVLVEGDLSIEQDMYNMYPGLEKMTRKIIEENIGEMHDDFASFMVSTPKERYKALLKKRPGLIQRVPQHQLASYLGITPESLSRIKKRLE